MQVQALLALLFTVIVWGVGPVFIRSLSVALGPSDHIVIRYTIVAIIYAIGLLILGGWRIARADWPRLMLISTVGMIGYNLGSAFGFELVPAGLGSLIIGTQPLLIAATGALIAREKLTPIAMLGLAVGFTGTVLLVWRDLGLSGDSASFIAGSVFIFFCGVAWAIYVVGAKPLIRKYGSYSITALSIIIASLIMIPMLARPSTLDTVMAMTPRNWLDMAYISILSTLIATITWNYGASRLPAAAAGAFIYLVPIIGVAAGALMLSETITPGMMLGGTMILAGVAIAQFGPLLKLERQGDGAGRHPLRRDHVGADPGGHALSRAGAVAPDGDGAAPLSGGPPRHRHSHRHRGKAHCATRLGPHRNRRPCRKPRLPDPGRLWHGDRSRKLDRADLRAGAGLHRALRRAAGGRPADRLAHRAACPSRCWARPR